MVSQDSTLEVLKEISPFALLPPEALEDLAGKARRKVFPAGSFVFRQGEESRRVLFVIVGGLAEVRVQGPTGKDTKAGYRKRGEFFGETVILSNKTYPASVRALSDLECLLIGRDDFEALLETHASFAAFFSQVLADRFRSLFHEVALEQSPTLTYEGHSSLKRAAELMSRPVLTCGPAETAAAAAQTMSRRHVSSLVVTDAAGRLKGLVTEKDLVEQVVAEGRDPTVMTVGALADPDPATVEPQTYYYQVLLELIKKGAKHAVVVEDRLPAGIITVRDLIRSRNAGVISVVDRLENQNNLTALASAGQEVDQVLRGLVAESAPVPEILEIITEFYDRLTRKVVELALAELEKKFGPPPVPFCWLTMGSSGRREQFFKTDQDNALIYQKPAGDESQAEQYFARLADLVVQGLIVCGFKPCPGYVMATNKAWRGSSGLWEKRLNSWVHQPDKANVRLLTIFLDFRPVYGYYPLADDLRRFTVARFKDHPLAMRFLAEDACQGRLPLSLLGNPLGERSGPHRDQLDLKGQAAVFWADCARVLALREGSLATGTLDRLEQLQSKNVFSGDFGEILKTAFQTIMLFRLRSGLERLNLGQEPDNYLPLNSLTAREKVLLKDALKATDKLVSLTREAFLF